MHVNRSAKVVAVVVGAVATLVLGAGPAGAHVEVVPESAPKGSEAILSFSVPNERDDATTTEVQVQLPTDRPLEDVRVQAKPGWTVSVEKDGSEITTITWSDGEIGADQFDLFTISAGLPKKGKHLHFKTLQTYSDGEVVRWIEEAEKGAPEPESPAPELELTSKKKSGGHSD